MVFLFWDRPSPEDQKKCIDKCGSFNYDSEYRGATAKTAVSLQQDRELAKKGYFVNHARVPVGSGFKTFEKGKSALQSWSGTLQGHLLAGEERFSIALDENDQVWYEILSISKPAHFLSLIGYPYVLLRQKYFAHQSSNAVRKYLAP
nr:UPF0548 protein At2g17695 [Ipomoea batatas]